MRVIYNVLNGWMLYTVRAKRKLCDFSWKTTCTILIIQSMIMGLDYELYELLFCFFYVRYGLILQQLWVEFMLLIDLELAENSNCSSTTKRNITCIYSKENEFVTDHVIYLAAQPPQVDDWGFPCRLIYIYIHDEPGWWYRLQGFI